MTPTKNKKKKKIKSKKTLKKKAAIKKVPRPKDAAPKKKKAAPKKRRPQGKSERRGTVVFEPKELGARSGGQSGDLQALSNSASADSESVDELLEEGNSFEAALVQGIEEVPDADQGEIKTREVPENDVPQEYLDKDN